MRFEGRVHPPLQREKYWSVEVPQLGIVSQGRGEADALLMIADAIETVVDQPGFEVRITPAGSGRFLVWANEPRHLIGLWLSQLRLEKKLTVRELAARLGSGSPEAWKRYESGRAMPTVEKLSELLQAVDPDAHYVFTRRAAG